jgi:hypothetical protein
VINIVNYDMVEQMSLASTEYPLGVSEFEKTGLTPIASDVVKPFRVKEAPVQFECKINDVVALGTQGGAGNLVICEVVRIHVAESILDEEGRISPIKIDQVARMGGHWYTRANKGLFQLPQPMTQIGIGFDALPTDIKTSHILTGNELAQLAGVESIPNETEVNEYKLTELADVFMEFEGRAAELEVQLHSLAKELLQQKKVVEAWMTLLSFNN